MILKEIYFSKNQLMEFIISYWVLTLALEEIRQAFFTDPSTKFDKKLSAYLRDGWNYLDIFGCLFFICGFTFRAVSFFHGEKYFIAARY